MLRSVFAFVFLAILAIGCAAPAAPPPAPTNVPVPTAAPVSTVAPTSIPVEPTATRPLKIVASTTWVGAFARAAGATDITVIAPASVQHPPDYDPKPSDLAAIQNADYILYAGFEGFAPRLQEAVGGDSSKLITVMTENSPAEIHAEVTRLGELFGTQQAAAEFLTRFDQEYTRLSEEVQAQVGDQKPVVVSQAFAAPWVLFAGLEPAGTYGPMPLAPGDLKTLTDMHPTFVFENYHMGGGQPVVEATGATKIDLLNFPDASLDLLAVFEENASRIQAAFAQTPAAAPTTTAPTAAPTTTAHGGSAIDPFAVSAGQYYLDTAGFHDMATVLSDTKKIDLEFRTRVARVSKILNQMPLPADLETQGHEFNETLDAFAIALRDDKVQDAITLSDEVHDAQHDLSHAVDEWLW